MADRDADDRRWSRWLTQAQAGDQGAYGALLSEINVVIRAYLISRFGQLENLEDCVQDSLLAIHQARHTYDGSRPFRPWMFAIVRNRSIDVLRKSARQRTGRDQTLNVGEESTEFEPIPAIDADNLLRRLSKNLRNTLILTKVMGYSTRECAARQGVSESVVKIRVYRGIRKLRILCEDDDDSKVS